MQIYSNMPLELVKGWVPSDEHEDFTEKPVGFHYHDVEEWLQVTKGKVTFISAGGMRYPLDVGEALQIPRGEVHDVEIGADGVDYKMWVPVAVPSERWENKLSDEDMDLIRTNLAVPGHEDSGNAQFFGGFLSDQLTFRTADGQVLDKERFLLRGFENRKRQPSDSVLVLHKTPQDVLLSNVVTLPGPAGPQSFTNLRLLVRGKGGSKCRVWLNYPEPGAKDAAARGAN